MIKKTHSKRENKESKWRRVYKTNPIPWIFKSQKLFLFIFFFYFPTKIPNSKTLAPSNAPLCKTIRAPKRKLSLAIVHFLFHSATEKSRNRKCSINNATHEPAEYINNATQLRNTGTRSIPRKKLKLESKKKKRKRREGEWNGCGSDLSTEVDLLHVNGNGIIGFWHGCGEHGSLALMKWSTHFKEASSTHQERNISPLMAYIRSTSILLSLFCFLSLFLSFSSEF